MTTPTDSRRLAIHCDLVRARRDLVEARCRQRQKDSTSNRAALDTCLSRMDLVLDRYLATENRDG